MKNKLFKPGNDQSTKQISNTLTKNELLKRENNQGTNQISITMRDSRIVACNPIKNELTFRSLPRPQSLNYRTTFSTVHPSGAYSGYTNTTSF